MEAPWLEPELDHSVSAPRHLRLIKTPPSRSEAAQTNGALRLSVIVPATDRPATLPRCLSAIRRAADPPAEIVVVETPIGAPPAVARNRGAALATGDVLVFVDADVEVHADAFTRIRTLFSDEADVAAIFGSYDDEPGSDDLISQFRNLLHHHVHHGSPGAIGTFWAGLGAIRREAFASTGGFVEHPIEDIELGMRLAAAGASILLDPRVQGKHLKRWTMLSMLKTDLLTRGAPWIGLALTHHSQPASLNCGWRHRVSATASVGAVAGLCLRRPRLALGAHVTVIALNRSFYALLLRRQGWRGTIVGALLHLVHQLTAVAAVPTGLALYAKEQRKGLGCESDSSV